MEDKETTKLIKERLSGNKTVRTTFNLKKDTIKKIDNLLNESQTTVKELFDVLQSIGEKFIQNSGKLFTSELKNDSDKSPKKSSIESIRKTFVIYQRTLNFLNKKSKEFDISRDSIIEVLVLLIESLIEMQEEREKEQREKAQNLISEITEKAAECEQEINNLLDSDDPIREQFSIIMTKLMELEKAIENNDFSSYY